MEQKDPKERQPYQGEERRQASHSDYQGEERRKSAPSPQQQAGQPGSDVH